MPYPISVDAGLSVRDTINVHDRGVFGDAATDYTTAIQSILDEAAGTGQGTVVYFPPGEYLISARLTLPDGCVIRGANAGTYPGDSSIHQASILSRTALMDDHLLYLPDGNNYAHILDMAIDGNRNNNSVGSGLYIADGASANECQCIIERCFFHDNPDANVYAGHYRQANKFLHSVFYRSENSDGITLAGSDNTVEGCICGSNARCGIAVGSTNTQNYSSTGFAAAVAHIVGNDCFGNVVGIAVAQDSSSVIVANNGVDRNTKDGITICNGDSNAIIGNTIHSNGTLTNNTYSHIDVGTNVGSVVIADNIFAPDDGITNKTKYAVNVHSSSTKVIGNFGVLDPTSVVTALTNSSASTIPWVWASQAGMVVQGSGNNVAEYKKSNGTTITKWTEGGSLVHSGGSIQISANADHVIGASSPVGSGANVLSLKTSDTAIAQLATQNVASQTAPILRCYASDGTTVLFQINADGTLTCLSVAPNAPYQLYGYLSWSYDPAMTSGGSALPAAGVVSLIKIPWPVTQSVTNIIITVSAGGTLTAGQCLAGIYSSAGTRLGVTADQSGVWNAAGSAPKTMAISGGPISIAGGGLNGFVYVAILWNGSAAPSLYKSVGGAAAIINGSLTASTLRGASNSSGNTSLPSSLTLSSSTAAGDLYWAALS